MYLYNTMLSSLFYMFRIGADVYDALVSKRVYKDEFSFEEANRIILESMGTHFDPNLEKYYLQARERIEEFYKNN